MLCTYDWTRQKPILAVMKIKDIKREYNTDLKEEIDKFLGAVNMNLSHVVIFLQYRMLNLK